MSAYLSLSRLHAIRTSFNLSSAFLSRQTSTTFSSTTRNFGTRTTPYCIIPSPLRTCQNARSPLVRRLHQSRQTRQNTTNSRPSPDPTSNLGSPEPALTLTQRMRKLSREYGWTAVGVYFALSALDFPFCFLAVRLVGTDRIGHIEHVIVNAFWRVVTLPFPDANKTEPVTPDGQEALPRPTESDAQPADWSWGVQEAQKQAEKDDASIWTQLALAYAIHKSFIFIRVPLTAAILPKVVKTLRGWGWKIGKVKPKGSS